MFIPSAVGGASAGQRVGHPVSSLPWGEPSKRSPNKNIIINYHQVTEITVKVEGNALIKLGIRKAPLRKSVGSEEPNTEIRIMSSCQQESSRRHLEGSTGSGLG